MISHWLILVLCVRVVCTMSGIAGKVCPNMQSYCMWHVGVTVPCDDAVYLPQLAEFPFVIFVGIVLFKGGISLPDVTVAGTSVPPLRADAEVLQSGFKSVLVALCCLPSGLLPIANSS